MIIKHFPLDANTEHEFYSVRDGAVVIPKKDEQQQEVIIPHFHIA